MPSSGDSCATCYYAFLVPASASVDLVGKLSCNYNAPFAEPKNEEWLWPIVAGDWWCGVGCDADTGNPFNAATKPPYPPANGTGTFSLAAQSSKTITDANCKATSNIKCWHISGDSAHLTITPGAGSFVADAGIARTGTYGYTIYN